MMNFASGFRGACRALLAVGFTFSSLVGASEGQAELCPGFEEDGLAIKSMDFSDFYRTEKQAVDVSALLDANVFDIRARPAADAKGWVVYATYRELPSVERFRRHRIELEALGKQFGGQGFMSGCRSETFEARR